MKEWNDILLVEDNPSDAELTTFVLKKNNAINGLLHLQNGEEALEYLFATGKFSGRNIGEVPRLIILDLKMPKVSGLEVVQKIKVDERTKMIPVILLTSSKEDSDISESYKAGINSYIVKPVEFENFEKVVSAIGSYWLLINQPPKSI